MRNLRKRALLGALAAAAALALPGAWAQTWPSRSVSIIVPFPAGGTTDVLARALGQELSKTLGQPVVVENKPGAGATLGADYVAKSKADGYTLLMGAVHHTIATSVYRKLGYDFEKDFAPITTVALVPNVLVVNPQVPAKTVQELLAQAKAQPGKLTYGSNGTGTGQHLIGAQFEGMGGVQLLHVPYKGSGPLTTDLLGGQISMSFDTVTPVLPHIKAGKLRALAVTTAKRSVALPDVPTLEEAGLPGFDMGTWFGMLAPAGTPKDIVARLNADMVKIIQSPEFRKKMDDIGADPIANTPEQMARQIKDDTARFARLVKEAKVSLD
ncbi:MULTISPECIES: tripartite tricarboxylate transporter substrate binding protein [Diaphorobacter]|mgnify:CR=1 FL=1|uniref:tripartite tricarboxylate transporter substrate binding protein n=1 Tax=Diaphorobacter TaxID=238749 RepID=UPI00107306F8|nr:MULTISPECIES: tripartite tricarboxylate transporter substrate binding protein [Diaphorobacter]QJY32678.1 tripartite tricarboxylate transporter substrate binding protein [Diaphorobacter sp. JS3050]QPN30673.1 tripartite tricarboxylate transporter substrate binding protein [Diaphorobacter sp. JS3051]TFI47588.1 tripartite tricarboxylate transporter substrate binding protein [Diaphorobacter sp. DS2]